MAYTMIYIFVIILNDIQCWCLQLRKKIIFYQSYSKTFHKKEKFIIQKFTIIPISILCTCQRRVMDFGFLQVFYTYYHHFYLCVFSFNFFEICYYNWTTIYSYFLKCFQIQISFRKYLQYLAFHYGKYLKWNHCPFYVRHASTPIHEAKPMKISPI